MKEVPNRLSVVAYYFGDANNASSSGSLIETVNQVPTTTVSANTTTAAYGAPITFMVTVVETAFCKPAQGLVLFLIGSTSYEDVVPDSTGKATWVTGATLPVAVVYDGNGNAWFANTGSISEFSGATALSPATGLGSLNSPAGIAVDASGNIWTANSGDNSVSIFVGFGSAVATPIAVNVGP